MRKHPDGTLWVPKRGTPPPVPEGYEIAPGDPFTFYPKLEKCRYRITKSAKSVCCEGIRSWMECLNEQGIVNRGYCKRCQDEGFW